MRADRRSGEGSKFNSPQGGYLCWGRYWISANWALPMQHPMGGGGKLPPSSEGRKSVHHTPSGTRLAGCLPFGSLWGKYAANGEAPEAIRSSTCAQMEQESKMNKKIKWTSE